MIYHGLWISFSDESNLFYNPISGTLVSHPMGEPMPAAYFFTSDLERHKEAVARLADGLCIDHAARLHHSEIRPQDPDWPSIHRERTENKIPFDDERDGPRNPW